MAASSRSLLDDADFLAALDRIDDPAAVDAARADEPHWVCDGPAGGTGGRARGRTALQVLGFTLMMGLGAAGAALVFQDRLAQLLR